MISNNLYKNKVTYKLFPYKLYIYIYIWWDKIWNETTHKGWYAIKHRPTNQILINIEIEHFREVPQILSTLESQQLNAWSKVGVFSILLFGHWGEWSMNDGPAVRVFANGPGDLGSIPGRVIPKTLKMELDTTLLNTRYYKVRFKGKVEQSREWSSALPYTLV